MKYEVLCVKEDDNFIKIKIRNDDIEKKIELYIFSVIEMVKVIGV